MVPLRRTRPPLNLPLQHLDQCPHYPHEALERRAGAGRGVLCHVRSLRALWSLWEAGAWSITLCTYSRSSPLLGDPSARVNVGTGLDVLPHCALKRLALGVGGDVHHAAFPPGLLTLTARKSRPGGGPIPATTSMICTHPRRSNAEATAGRRWGASRRSRGGTPARTRRSPEANAATWYMEVTGRRDP